MTANLSKGMVLAFLFVSSTIPLSAAEPEIISVEKIWDLGEHNAFTDLIRFRDHWWCTFREAKNHGPSNGKVRVIVSKEGDDWTSAALVEQDGVDLRDPKLSVTPDGRLLLMMGGSIYSKGNPYGTRAPRASFSKDGRRWTQPRKLLAEDHWLWRVTWRDGWAWSVSKLGEGRDPRRGMLYRSRDAVDWEWITEFRLPNNTWNASETTLRFLPDGEMVALTRPHWIGTSRPPYTKWSWSKMKENIGGPNFIRIPDGSLWAAGRHYGQKRTTVLARMTRDRYEPVLTLPSSGDCSYPGMVWHAEKLWMSYYSSHEGKTSIYLAKIKVPLRKLTATRGPAGSTDSLSVTVTSGHVQAADQTKPDAGLRNTKAKSLSLTAVKTARKKAAQRKRRLVVHKAGRIGNPSYLSDGDPMNSNHRGLFEPNAPPWVWLRSGSLSARLQSTAPNHRGTFLPVRKGGHFYLWTTEKGF